MAIMELSRKVCRRCKEEKPFAEFHKAKARTDGLQCICKQCSKEVRHRNYERNKARPQHIVDALRNLLVKLCRKCNTDKQLVEFRNDLGTKDGLLNWCKQCERDSKQRIWEQNKARPQHIVDALQNQLVKQCCRCGTNKPLSDFNKSHGNHDGLQKTCKQCSREAGKRSRQRNKERPQDVIDTSQSLLKLCNQCNTEKIRSEFARDSSRMDGLSTYCSECRKLITSNYYLKFRVKFIEHNRTYYESNKTLLAIANAAWVKDNPERSAAIKAKRRAQKKSAPGSYTGEDVKKLMLLQRGKCPVCKKDIRDKYHVDHVTALARGGTNNADNLQLLCQRCNNQKHAKDPIDFMQQKGYLL